MESSAVTALPFVILMFLLVFVVSILFTAFWIWMIVDCARRDFKKENDKILWILVVVLAGIIGALIYYFVVKLEQDRKKKK